MNSSDHQHAQPRFSLGSISGTSAVALAACVLLAGCSLGGKSRLAAKQNSVDATSPTSSGGTALAGAPQMGRSPAADAARDAADGGAPVALASFDRPADRNFPLPHGLAGGQVAHAKSNDFDQLVLHSDVPVLVDFYADWCGPCKKLAPSLDQLAQEMPNARIVKVNIDDSPELARRYRVGPIPSLQVFRNGEVADSHVGYASKEKLRSLLTGS